MLNLLILTIMIKILRLKTYKVAKMISMKNKIIFKADFRFSQGSYNISLEFSTLLGSQFETSSYTTAFIGQGLKHLTKLLEMKHLAATDF